jgi:hypothetical protein
MQGLQSERVTPAEVMALRYELGLAFESMGRFGEAFKFFEKAAATNPSFRDVQVRLEETRRRGAEETGNVGHDFDELLKEPAPGRGSSKISYV